MPEFIDAEILPNEPQMTQSAPRPDGESVTQFSLRDTRSPAPINHQLSTINSPWITIRPGTLDDLPFIDKLQKKQSKQVGFFPTQALEGKIALGHVLVAEIAGTADGADDADSRTDVSAPSAKSAVSGRLGYLIGNDQYFKRDDVGCIFQINVVPEFRRSLVAAMLLKAQFERSSWGCKLYCCWCAQDIEANRFWEAMGFVPLAFRTGSTKGKGSGVGVRSSGNAAEWTSPNPRHRTLNPRIHIFWQKRIRQGDETTPWWFPCKTGGGSLREDRIVLPIPPGTRWDETMPILLPEVQGSGVGVQGSGTDGLRPEPRTLNPKTPSSNRQSEIGNRQSNDRPAIRMGGMWSAAAVKVKKPKRKHVHDPALVQRARELRDRWLEQMNANPNALLPRPRYEVGRMLPPIDPPMRQIAA